MGGVFLNSISISQLLKKKNVTIIDIRSHNLYLQGHIPGAISIEEKELLFYPKKYLNHQNIYYLYCSSGNRSFRLSTMLNRMGYHTVNVVGGYQNYLLN